MSFSRFFTYNLPLQVWPIYAEDDEDDEDETGDVVDCRIGTYMPRKEHYTNLNLSDLLELGGTREEFLERAALVLENLARLMREAKSNPKLTIYYPDEGMGAPSTDVMTGGREPE